MQSFKGLPLTQVKLLAFLFLSVRILEMLPLFFFFF